MATRRDLTSYLWTDVINALSRDVALDNIMAHCKRNRDGPFSETGPAIERLLNSGASRHDLCLVLRATAYDAVFGTLYAINDPGVDDNDVFIREELLSAEPNGMDEGPGSRGAT